MIQIMVEPYDNWSNDLFYSAEIQLPSDLNTQVLNPQSENLESPTRPRRFLGNPSTTTLNLTPNLKRSPLSTLKQTPEGLLYSPNP